MKTPKEDPADKAARERERRLSELDRNAAAQKNAGGLSTDLRSVYGLRSMSLFGTAGPTIGATPLPSPGLPPTLRAKQKDDRGAREREKSR